MFRKLLGKILPDGRSVDSNANQAQTPDISRVIKIHKPVAPVEDEAETVLDADALASKAEAAMDSLAGQFETWMSMDLGRLIAAWQAAQESESDPECYRALFTAAHNIRGAAPSYGYPAISRLCGSLCTLLEDTRPGENSALINLHIEACRAAFGSVGRGESAQSVADAVCDALERRVAVAANAAGN
ncbi:Hpt domain-containing protein [Hyphomonas johnsonii]|uniref:HPt domain-containing protein n=1 Tax=Hyphomonas johnsonii MHS-2 TaxID=1280950 RepID=A0A059FV83_9PROT|nr:Hpt domain-containing protein [Hyphomonas johnsonii]KCZ94595.1 hypothetical protein HJO_04435 [Hyphomonas johnsonii MHS-2]